MPRPALPSIAATPRISASGPVRLAPHSSVNHITSAWCGLPSLIRSAEHQVCGRLGPSSTRSPSS